jgi:hypothetical protein
LVWNKFSLFSPVGEERSVSVKHTLPLDIIKKATVTVQKDIRYHPPYLKGKLWNQYCMLLMTYHYMKPVAKYVTKHFLFIAKAENDINKGKKIRDRIKYFKIFKKKRFQKTTFERRTCKIH